MVTVIEQLNNAKNRLLEQGWSQFTFGYEEGPNCLWGALHFSNPEEQTPRQAISALNYAIYGREHIFTPLSITGFNDGPSTTFNDVLDVIDQAISYEKEKEA